MLARKKQRENQSKIKGHHDSGNIKSELLDDLKPLTGFKADPSAAAIPTSATMAGIWPYNAASFANYYNPSMDANDNMIQTLAAISGNNSLLTSSMMTRPIQGQQENAIDGEHTIASSKLTLCGFEAYVQQLGSDKHVMLRIPKVADEPLEDINFDSIRNNYPQFLEKLFKSGPSDAFFVVKCWANVDFKTGNPSTMAYAVDSFYNSKYNFDISVSTKVCSFGKQVVEKVEVKIEILFKF